MRDKKEFFELLTEIDSQPLDAAKQLAGDFDFSRYVLKMDDLRGSSATGNVPFIVRVPAVISQFPPELFSSPLRCTALEDYLTRQMAMQFDTLAEFDDEGRAVRHLQIADPVDMILPRSSMVVTEEFIEARILIRLSSDRKILDAETLQTIFFDELPEAVNASLLYYNLDEQDLAHFVTDMEDMDEIRQMLPTQGLVAFVPDSVQVEPVDPDSNAALVTVQCEEGACMNISTPHEVTVSGIGIKQGITVILGDEYSGRHALMQAIAQGIYNRVTVDRRPIVITVPDAVYVAAEPGRSIQKVDLSLFVQAQEVETEQFSTDSAGAYESQAATVIENLEVGAHVLLFDETDSAPSFFGHDQRLDALIGSQNGALPLSAVARQIVDELGVSLIIAGSGSVGEYLSIADTVLRLDNGRLSDVTQQAKGVGIAAQPAGLDTKDLHALIEKSRCVVPSCIDPSLGVDDAVIEALDAGLLQFGRVWVDLTSLNQLVDIHQTHTIGLILYYARLRYMNENRSLREILDLIDRDLSTEGLECLSGALRGDLARPRRYEIAAALNRLPMLRIARKEE